MIHLEIDMNDVAAELGMTLEELNRRLLELERKNEQQVIVVSPEVPIEKRFIYSHLNHGSGICPMCAPWLNVPTTGAGIHVENGIEVYSDGVPVVPQHPRCKCYLAPLWTEAFETQNAPDQMDHFEWMQSLPKSRLQRIIGKVRTGLVMKGLITIPELYDAKLFVLIALKKLGFDDKGNPASE
jgi:hypothetical protein